MQNIKPLATIAGYLGATVPAAKKLASLLGCTASGLTSLR